MESFEIRPRFWETIVYRKWDYPPLVLRPDEAASWPLANWVQRPEIWIEESVRVRVPPATIPEVRDGKCLASVTFYLLEWSPVLRNGRIERLLHPRYIRGKVHLMWVYHQPLGS